MNLFGYTLIKTAHYDDMRTAIQARDVTLDKMMKAALRRQEEIKIVLNALNDIIHMQTPSMGGTTTKMHRRAKEGFKQWRELKWPELVGK